MPVPDVLTIAGVPVDLAATSTALDSLTAFARGGVPELGFSRILRTPAPLPDPWNLKPCSLKILGTTVFSGWVTGYIDRYEGRTGWLREYRALGLQYAANYIPVTDDNTFTDTSTWNLPSDDPAMIASRAGQSVGAIVQAILVMPTNAQPLAAAGIGAYTSLSPPTLPAATLADLAALSFIPPQAVRVAGERILQALEGMVQTFHPNHFLHLQPDGTIRFLDPRTFPDTQIAINGPDPRWAMPDLTRDASDNYSQVKVRGDTWVRAVMLQDKPWPGSTLADGGLAEWFAHDGLTEAQAKAAWLPSDWSQPNTGVGSPMESGACTATDSTHLVLSVAHAYTANQLAQGAGEMLGWINVIADSLNGMVNQYWLARVISNTASSGGSVTVTIDTPLPSLAYNGYQLYGLAAGANVVGRRYRVTNPALAHTLQQFFPYPMPLVTSLGSTAQQVSSPTGLVWYSPVGSPDPPYNISSVGLTIDPDGGLIYFDTPVQFMAGGFTVPVRWPAVVQAFLAVGTEALEVFAPSATAYAGTLFTVEGVQRTKTVTVMEWRDPSNTQNMQVFANEVLDAVKNVVVEGSLPYFGLPGVDWLAPGKSVSIGGQGWATGWEALQLPVVAVDLAFQHDPPGTSYLTTLRLSNRRTPYDASNFLRPNLTGAWMASGLEGILGAPPPTAEGMAMAQQQFQATRQQNLEETARAFLETRANMGRPAGPPGQVVDPFAAMMAGMQGGAAQFAGGMAAQAGAVAGGFGAQAGMAAGAGFGPIPVTPTVDWGQVLGGMQGQQPLAEQQELRQEPGAEQPEVIRAFPSRAAMVPKGPP